MKRTFQELLNTIPKYCAPTGRVIKGLKDTTGIRQIPSCTNFDFRHWEQIDEALTQTSQRLRGGAGVAIQVYNSVEFPQGVPLSRGKSTTKKHKDPNGSKVPWYVYTKEAPIVPGYYSIIVGDTMQRDPEVTYGSVISIEDSWVAFIECLFMRKPVIVDLSRLRAAGTTSTSGIIASGAETFAEIYERLAELVEHPGVISFMRAISRITEVIRRGGVAFKKGATTIFLDMNHPQASDFITLPSKFVEKTKRAIYVSAEWMDDPALAVTKKHMVTALNKGSIFIANRDKLGEYRTQVCVEILFKSKVIDLGLDQTQGYLRHRYTHKAPSCLLTHFNAGAITPDNLNELPREFGKVAQWICDLHESSGLDAVDNVLSPQEDPQVGMGLIGFANHLAQMGVTYKEFAQDMQEIRRSWELGLPLSEMKDCLAYHWWNAYATAAVFFRDYFYVRLRVEENARAFTQPPTQSSASQFKDAHGFTCARGFEPPVGLLENNASQTEGSTTNRYPTNIETYDQVGYETYRKLSEEFQLMWEFFNLAHIQSHNVPKYVTIDEAWVRQFIHDGILGSVYYRTGTDQKVFVKDSVLSEKVVDLASCNITDGCTSCAGG